MTTKIKVSIQEITYDFYNLGETEGYLTGLSEAVILGEKEIENYCKFIFDMTKKYLPNTLERYKNNDEKDIDNAIKLSSILFENFTEIFCKLI
jgi:hypothetical protein